MRVAFDTAPLAETAAGRRFPFGVRRACAGLLAALTERGRSEVVPMAPEPDESPLLWRQKRLPARLESARVAGFHSSVSAFPILGRGKRVQTVHEAPWRFGVAENAGWKHRSWAAMGPLLADAVLCPSTHTKQALMHSVLGGGAKIAVCPWGVEESFQDESPPGVVDEVMLSRYALPEGPFALCLGAVRKKKNLPALLHGLLEHMQSGAAGLPVIVTGEETADLRRDLGLVSRLKLSRWVRTPGVIIPADLPSVLRLATVVVVLSHSEGFAFPVLEALASGTPVLVSKDSAQAELAGAEGIVVDPEDPTSVAEGLGRALAEREALRYTLAARAAEFSWARCARQVEELWLGWQR